MLHILTCDLYKHELIEYIFIYSKLNVQQLQKIQKEHVCSNKIILFKVKPYIFGGNIRSSHIKTFFLLLCKDM